MVSFFDRVGRLNMPAKQLQVGFLVTWEGRPARVRGIDLSMRQVTLSFPNSLESLTVNDDDPKLISVANPAKDWALLSLPTATAPYKEVKMLQGRKILTLDLFSDWLPCDPFKKGGPIYLNPKVGARPGDVLTLVYTNGRAKKFTVPTTLKTFQEAQETAAREKTPCDPFTWGGGGER